MLSADLAYCIGEPASDWLVIMPDGLPIAYEVMPGNTSDRSTLREFLKKIEARYGKARRMWVMDRGIPTEEVLDEMRAEGVQYLVGTPKGQLREVEQALLEKPWQEVHAGVSVKLLERLGALKQEAGRSAALVEITVPTPGEPVNARTFGPPRRINFRLSKERFKAAKKLDGKYLLRTNVSGEDPPQEPAQETSPCSADL